MNLKRYQKEFQHYLDERNWIREPKNLYEPINYIMQLLGKRIRPVLTLMTCDLLSGTYKKALPAALAVEMFHNFTLIHDDIMDNALLRRGQKTVHEKWGLNTGILSGDAMLVLAYQCFDGYTPEIFQKLVVLFGKTALELCEGQQLDLDFEKRNDVTIDQYIEMIRLKTSVLVATALKMGAIVGESSQENADLLYQYGINLGIAFQLQDDYLDTFGNPKTFGKQVGGDIIENKKTFLYLKACELSESRDRERLSFLYNHEADKALKIEEVKKIFKKYNIPSLIKERIHNYTDLSFSLLDKMTVSHSGKETLREFGSLLMDRNQ